MQLKKWIKRNILYIVMYAFIIAVALLSVSVYKLSHAAHTHATPTYNDVVTITLPVEAPIEKAPIETPLIETPLIEEAPISDLVLLASILEAECWEGDWRKEATVIMNRLISNKKYLNPDGTLKGLLENGHFDGAYVYAYEEKQYSQKAYDAAYEVLIEGYRSWNGDTDMLYFSNLVTATDKAFIEGTNWVEKQPNERSHSFGKDY